MSDSLPFSLSPHVAVLVSPELNDLLKNRKLPPLPDLLGSFTPLESISTRTTGLATITHDKYFIRFSDLLEVESACKEDEEVRASRMFDWMGGRVSRRASTWVKDVEERPLNLSKDMKWWEDVRLCAEGDMAPNRSEGWNHPVALILATSTTASNPLQSVTTLHSRLVDLPPWVDPAMLKFTLIVHPTASSPLNMDESQALLNAVKKQYGPHSHLMCWSLPGTRATNPFIPPLPRLPLPPSGTLDTPGRHHLDDILEPLEGTGTAMGDEDLQTANRFVREFVTQSLIPWMERNVVEWNESYVATRRLPSRLFSTTRRLFGTSGPTTPVPSSPSSPAPSTAVQQRRLAEFATFLGDVKLATSVFDTLRKDTSNTSASDVLPLLLAPAKTLESHVINALVGARLIVKDPSPASQLRALKYAVRWERGIRELNSIGGDQWLVWAAGPSEEAPSALLVAQSAQMCARKGSLRRATLCYVTAANRLDKCGIKPLTMHFLRLARDLCSAPVPKSLSPAFFEAEDDTHCGFDGIAPGIEHALGRLKYTTGDTEGAVKTFITLLRSTNLREATRGDDKIYLEDFKLALEHLISTSGEATASELKFPIQFSQPKKTQIRVGTLDPDDDIELWEQLEESWKTFWKPNGPVTLRSSGRAQAEEMFWVELSMHNPLDAEVTLSDLNLTVDAPDDVEVTTESLAEVVLRPKETRLLHMSLMCRSSGTIVISQITYRFLSLLTVTESLTWRGARLHATPQQRQGKVYAPDHTVRVQVLPRGARLDIELAEADSRSMVVGELRDAIVRVEHPVAGGSTEPITDVWAVMGEAGWPILPQCLDHQNDDNPPTNTLDIQNTLDSPKPVRLPLERLTGSPLLALGKHLDLQLAYCGHEPGLHDILVLLVFRKENDEIFYTARMRIPFHVEPSLQLVTHVQPSADTTHCAYTLTAEIENTGSHDVTISQLSTIAIAWVQADPKADSRLSLSISSAQLGRALATLVPCTGSEHFNRIAEAIETQSFTARQFRSVLDGVHEARAPPHVHVPWAHASRSSSISVALIRHFVLASRRAHVLRQLRTQLGLLPSGRAANLVPLLGAHDLDVVVEYSCTSRGTRGLLFAHGLQVGGPQGVISEEKGLPAKKKGRSMYAETERELEMLATQIRGSTWNSSGPCVSVDVRQSMPEATVQVGKMSPIPVTFTLRNFSLSRRVKCVLDLKRQSDTSLSLSPSCFPASYIGQTVFRRTLLPLETCHIIARMAVSRPGIYGLGGWVVRCEVAASDNLGDQWEAGEVYVVAAPEPEEQDVVINSLS